MLSIVSPSSRRTTSLVQSNNTLFIITVALIIFSVSYSFLLSFNQYLLGDADTLWHIRTAQWILHHAQFPILDFYSYTAFGKPWISTEWLSEIFYALAFKFGGWRGVAILGTTACAAIIGILCFYLLRHLRFSVAVGSTILTALVISPHFVARPHLFSYVLLAIWTINLVDAYDDDKFDLPSLLILAPLMILWANIHGSFTFGLALLYVFAGFCVYHNVLQRNYAKCRRLLIVTAVVSASALITPYGILPVFMTTKLMSMKFAHTFIIEWRQPDFQGNFVRLIYMVSILSVISGLGIRLRGPRLIAFILLTVMALSYVRGLMMFFMLMPIILARPAAGCIRVIMPQLSGMKTSDSDKASDPVLRFLQKRSSAILAGCMALALLITVRSWWREDFFPAKAIAPKGAIDFVQRTNITGNVFNSYNFGGYLIFAGIPTFIDGRAELFGDAFLQKYSDAVNLIEINSAFEMLDEYKVSWILLIPSQPLAKELARSELWKVVYSDEDSIVFVRYR